MAVTATLLGPYKPNDGASVKAAVEATVAAATDQVAMTVHEGNLYVLVVHVA